MNGVIITGGRFPDVIQVKHFLSDDDYIIAADSGYDNAKKLGIYPHLVIGDFDSITAEIPDSIPNISYPIHKDYTDTELAAEYLMQNGYRYKLLIGGGEGRFDHTLSLVDAYSKAVYPDIWITEREIIYAFTGNFELVLSKTESIISVINPGKHSARVDSNGLFWELDTYTLERGRSSISNKNVDEKVSFHSDSIYPLLISVAF